MTDTGWLFRASWPILDDSLTLSEVRAEASAEVDTIAREVGCRIAGQLAWTVLDRRLYVEGPATPLLAPVDAESGRVRYGAVTRRAEQIRQLAAAAWTDKRIASEFGCTESAVAKVRARFGIPPGVGNPTMSGEQQRKGRAA